MSLREAFGPNLRRRRLRAGVSLEDIARATRVSVEHWEALERNDLSNWPTGIYARMYIREYAAAIGIDPDEAVNDFCRAFPHGDRRAERLLRGTADLVGHRLEWRDHLPPGVAVDRRAPAPPPESGRRDARKLRLAAAAVDFGAVALVSLAVVKLLPVSYWTALAVTAALYHGISLTVAGSSPAVWAIDAYADAHPEILKRHRGLLFRRLQSSRKAS